MNLQWLGFAMIVNNMTLDVPDTVQDMKALSSALETIGFEVKFQNGLNAQVTFQNIFLGDFGLIQRLFEELFMKTAQEEPIPVM